jgi:hypothetical protein
MFPVAKNKDKSGSSTGAMLNGGNIIMPITFTIEKHKQDRKYNDPDSGLSFLRKIYGVLWQL